MEYSARLAPALTPEQAISVQITDHVEMLALLRLIAQNQLEIIASMKGTSQDELAKGFETAFQRCYAEAAQNLNVKLQQVAQQARAEGTAPQP